MVKKPSPSLKDLLGAEPMSSNPMNVPWDLKKKPTKHKKKKPSNKSK